MIKTNMKMHSFRVSETEEKLLSWKDGKIGSVQELGVLLRCILGMYLHVYFIQTC